MKARSSLRRFVPIALAAALLGLAMGPVAGKWRLVDCMRIVVQVPKLQSYKSVLIHNTGADNVTVSAKVVGNPIPVPLGVCPNNPPLAAYCTYVLPANTKSVIVQDAACGNGSGSKGTLLWIL